MHDRSIRERARATYEALGPAAAARATGIGKTTIKRWARAGNWQRPSQRVQPDTAVHTPAEGPVTPVSPAVWPLQKSNGDHSAPSEGHSRDPARELQADADLARRVYRQQGEAVLDGRGKPIWFRDATVAHGIMQDKRAAYGGPAGLARDEPGLSKEERRARREQRIYRLIEILEQTEARDLDGG